MDTLFWTQFNPEVSIEFVTKKYFNTYLYKLCVYAPAGRLIDDWEDIDNALIRRKEIAERQINWGGSWVTRNRTEVNSADPEFLALLGKLKHDHDEFRFRVEEPNISIYAETEQELKDLVTTNFNNKQHQYIRKFFGPESDDAVKILNSGAIIRRTNNEYKYKVVIRDGKYSPETKSTLYNYLMNSGETMISKGCQDQLNKSFSFMWNVFFYTNDPNVIHFINLIAPDSIANIHELVVLDNK